MLYLGQNNKPAFENKIFHLGKSLCTYVASIPKYLQALSVLQDLELKLQWGNSVCECTWLKLYSEDTLPTHHYSLPTPKWEKNTKE